MDKGLLIRELAEQLGVTEDTVINWEKRGRRPAKRHMQKIADFIPDVPTVLPPNLGQLNLTPFKIKPQLFRT